MSRLPMDLSTLSSLTSLRRASPLAGKKGSSSLRSFPWIGNSESIKEMISAREKLFSDMRSAKTWAEVYGLLDEHGYSLIQSEEQCFAVNLERGSVFGLSDCGHNLQVFIERLGEPPGRG